MIRGAVITLSAFIAASAAAVPLPDVVVYGTAKNQGVPVTSGVTGQVGATVYNATFNTENSITYYVLRIAAGISYGTLPAGAVDLEAADPATRTLTIKINGTPVEQPPLVLSQPGTARLDITITVSAVCGDGWVQSPEDCDDGGTVDGDCCSASCAYEPSGNSCSDGNACTVGDTCDGAGGCAPGAPQACNDTDICTDDSCDPGTGCVYTNNTAPCPDGDVCNGDEVCDGAGTCAVGTPLVCDDANVCTDDSCNAASGCLFAFNTATCDDGNECTTGIACSAGTCGTPTVCNDANICTDDSCDPGTGCVNINNTVPCPDGDVCNGDEVCDGAGTCAVGTPLVCDDADACTADSCDLISGCQHDATCALFTGKLSLRQGGLYYPIAYDEGTLMGSGTAAIGGSYPISVQVPWNAFAAQTSGSLATPPAPYTMFTTQANFKNETGWFSVGGGFTTHMTTSVRGYKNTFLGSLYVNPGKNQFGGTMRLLGTLRRQIAGKTSFGYDFWASQGLPIRHVGTGWYMNGFVTSSGTYLGKTTTGRSWGVRWTTGFIRLWNSFTSVSSASTSGYDNRTNSGLSGTLRLVTPRIVATGPPPQKRKLGFAVLEFRFVPEPVAGMALAVGLLGLVLLWRFHRRSGRGR